MAKESMKARQAKRERLGSSRRTVTMRPSRSFPATLLPCAFTTSARCLAVPRVTCASSASHVSTSARWLLTA